MTHWTDSLENLEACGAAVAWAQDYDSLDAAWAACERGDWMLWLLARVAQHGSPEHKAVVATACACARRALRFVVVPTSELQPAWQAIELAERWAQGETVSLDDLCQARQAAYDAANEAAYAADMTASAAAYAAAAAAEAAAATYKAVAASAAAEAAAAAAHAAFAAGEATAAEHAAIADLIRKRHVAPLISRPDAIRGHLIISFDRLLNAPANHDVTEHVEEGNVEEGKRNVHSLNNSYSKPRTIYLTPYDMAYALFLGAIAGLCIGALITY